MKPKTNAIGWFEIYVQEMNRAKKFYENVLQTKLEQIPTPSLEMWVFPPMGEPTLPGCSGALVRMEGKDSGGGGTIVYFMCDDCAVEAARAVEQGGRLQRAKMSIGQYGFIALVYDTEGNMIGLHSMK